MVDFLYIVARINVPNAPTPATSVGVAIPENIEPRSAILIGVASSGAGALEGENTPMVGARGFTSRFLHYALRVVVANALTIKIASCNFVNLFIRFQHPLNFPNISLSLLVKSKIMECEFVTRIYAAHPASRPSGRRR